jgi:F-type H+-transporting ATPase subunit b
MNINLTMFAQALSFAILIWFTARFVWPPLIKAVEDRQKTIADGLAAGERGKHELEISAKRSAESLVGAKAELDQEVFRTKESLRQQVADLVVSGAEKILRREIDAKAHADILSAVSSQL